MIGPVRQGEREGYMVHRDRERRQRLQGGIHTCTIVAMVLALVGMLASAASPQPKAYVTNERSNDLSVIDSATDKVIATIPVGERPRGIRLSPDGQRVYVALGDEDRIAVVDTTSLQVVEKISAGTDPSRSISVLMANASSFPMKTPIPLPSSTWRHGKSWPRCR